ncbi:hypothetical protein, partial [uncultured Cetobacterium sp.]|uniref:hypothetical protein n=1 Tax=uncultured Cetobacterium sp. TaxID=527638 RepID=UPI0026232B73
MSNKYKKIEQISIQSQLFKNLYHNLVPGHNFQELSNLIHSYDLKQIKSIKPILNQYSNLKIHKSYYHYINLNKNIIKYYPNINEILNINNSIFNLDLNLPYHV